MLMEGLGLAVAAVTVGLCSHPLTSEKPVFMHGVNQIFEPTMTWHVQRRTRSRTGQQREHGDKCDQEHVAALPEWDRSVLEQDMSAAAPSPCPDASWPSPSRRTPPPIQRDPSSLPFYAYWATSRSRAGQQTEHGDKCDQEHVAALSGCERSALEQDVASPPSPSPKELPLYS